MDIIELNTLSAEAGTQTTSVAVPRPLLEELAEDPAQFGLPSGVSRRRALGLLLIKGARAGAFETREAAMEEAYRSLHADSEWQEAAAEAQAEAREDGIL